MSESTERRTIEVRVLRSRVKIPVIFLLPVMLLATLYCTLYFYLNSNWLVDRAPGWLHAGFGGDFEVAELVVDPSLVTVHVYGATISRSGEQTPVIEAPETHASLDPIHLLNGRIVMDRGHSRGATVRLAFDEDGTINILEALGIEPDEPTPDEEPVLSIALENLRADDAEFILVRDEFDLRIPQVDVPDARVAVESGELNMSVDRLDVPTVDFRFHPELFGFPSDYGDWTFSANDVDVRKWRWRGDGFAVDRVSFGAEGAEASASGRMEFPADETDASGMRYDGSAEVSIPYWSPLVQYFIRHTVHFHVPEARIAVDGTLEMIDGVFQARADLLEVSGLEFRNVRGEATLQNENILLEEGRADFYEGTVQLDRAYFNMFEVAYGAEGRFEGVDPAAMLAGLGAEVPSLRGALSGGVRVTGAVPMGQEVSADDPLPLLTDATRELADVVVTEPWQYRFERTMPWPGRRLTLGRGSEIRVNYERVMLGDATISAGPDRLDVNHFELDYNQMEFRSPTAAEPVDVGLHVHDIGPYARQLGLTGLEGRVDVPLTARGPVGAPNARFRARGEALRIDTGGETLEVPRARADGRLEDGRLEVPTVEIDGEAGTVVGRGSARLWGGRRRLEGHFEVSDAQLGVVDRVLGLGLGLYGRLEAEGTLAGYLDRPRVTFEAGIDDGGIRGAGVRTLRARGQVGPEELEFKEWTTELVGGGRLQGSGRLGFERGTYRVRLDARSIDLGAVAAVGGVPSVVRPSGTLRARLHGNGSISEPDLAGDLEIDDLRVGPESLGDLSMVVDTVDQVLHFVGGMPSLASLKVEIPTDGRRWYHVRLGADRLDLGERVPQLAEIPAIRRLLVTGAVDLDVAPDLSDYTVVTDLEEVVMKTPETTFRTRGPVRIGAGRGGRLQIESLELGSDGDFLDVGGGLTLESGWSQLWNDPPRELLSSLELELDGPLNLNLIDILGRHLFADVLPQALVESEGKLNVQNLKLEESEGGFKPLGTVQFERAKFVFRGLGEPLRIHAGTLEFQKDRVMIPDQKWVDDSEEGTDDNSDDGSSKRKFVGEMLGGEFSLSGTSNYVDGWPVDADLELWSHNMMYRVPGWANMTFDTDIRLRATSLFDPETWLVSGRLNILDAVYFRDISLFEKQLAGRVLGAFSRETERYEMGLLESQPWIGDISFDLGIRARDGVRIESDIDRFGLDLELRLDLQLEQRLRDPRVSGEVDVLDGTVDFQGETFEVRRGTIEYTGNPRNPRVTIAAGADIRNRCTGQTFNDNYAETFNFSGDFGDSQQETYHVVLNVEGQLENLNIQLESTPYADQRDILSLILTGCTVDALTASNATQPTLEIALGPLLGRFEREVRDVVKLSEFSIMPGVERTQVRIGNQLARRLVWRFQLDTGLSEREGGQKTQLEWRISDTLSAEFSERSRGETQDLLLDAKLKYRLPLD